MQHQHGMSDNGVCTPRFPEIPPVHMDEHHISIQNYAFWSEHSSFRLHETPQTTNSCLTGSCHSTYNLYRRYTHISEHSTSPIPGYPPNNFPTNTVRVQNKSGEIDPYPKPGDRIPRDEGQFSNNDIEPPTKLADKHNITVSISNTQKPMHCTPTGRTDRHTNLFQDGNTPNTAILSLPTTGSVTKDTGEQKLGHDGSPEPRLPLRSAVVGKECESPQLNTNTQTGSQRGYANRCLSNRLGSSMENHSSLRPMDSKGGISPHKRTRAESNYVRRKDVRQTRLPPANPNGQQICHSVYQQAWRHPLKDPLLN